ncbi:MAG: lysine transporter LysE [Herbaspirillum sp.]|jgi:threonine/homoserine/homoserine lactone efflux protein|nr:lysine transporter LysE [Herbaspirillum sp.]
MNLGGSIFSLNALLKMSLYGSLVLMLPGPTNTLLLSSGLKVGIRRTLPLVAAEALGYVTAISLWGFFLLSFATSAPWFLDVVKLLCSVYILWLAVKMWTQSRMLDDRNAGPVSIREIFAVTVMNPKALLFASTLFPLEAFKSAEYFACAVIAFLMILAPISIAWSSLGGLLTSRPSWANHTSTYLRSGSLVLVVFSGSLAYSIFRL